MSAQAGSGPAILPPTRILSEETVTQSAAHDFLAAYLDRAATDPALQPDSTLSGHGPVSANSGAAPNLIIHNLRRVQAGLAGQVLGKDPVFAKLDAGVLEDVYGDDYENENANKNVKGKKKGADIEWQDREAFERQQEVLEIAGGDGEENEGGIQIDNPEVMDAEMDTTGGVDKEERKRLKKERRKAEQRARAQG